MKDRRFPREDALAVATELTTTLQPCAFPGRIIIAGSLRRMKPDVHDIDIVVESRVVKVKDEMSLFGDMVDVFAVSQQVNTWLREGTVRKDRDASGRETFGPRVKRLVHVASGIPVDLYLCTAENYFNTLVLRTGSVESNVKVCNAAIERGWVWCPESAGFMRNGVVVAKVRREADVFDAVGLPYLPPSERG